MAELRLWFSLRRSPELEKSFFRAPLLDGERWAVRGKTAGAYSNCGTFQWTNAVRALALLFLKTKLLEFTKEHDPLLRGGEGTLASSLDYAISKQPIWLLDMLGLYPDGRPVAQRLFRRTNPERKKGGDVIIGVNTSLLSPDQIRIFMSEDELCTREEIEELIGQIAGEHVKGVKSPSPAVEAPSVQKSRKRLIMLPFEGVQNEPKVRELFEGFYEELVVILSRLRGIDVISPQSAKIFSPETMSVLSFAQQLKADVLMTGALRLVGTRSTLFIQLVEVATEVVLWADSLTLHASDLAVGSSRLAIKIAQALQLTLTPREEDTLRRRELVDRQAFELYLQALGLSLTNQRTDVLRAQSLLEEALSIDPSMSDARALIGYIYSLRYHFGWEADDTTLLAAEQEARQALLENSKSALACMTLVDVYWNLGKTEDGVSTALSMYTLDSRNIHARTGLGAAYMNAGMAELAVPLYRKALMTDPLNPRARRGLAWSNMLLKRFDELIVYGIPYLEAQPHDSDVASAVATALFERGQPYEALRIAKSTFEKAPHSGNLCLQIGKILTHLNEDEAARENYDEGVAVMTYSLNGYENNHRIRIWRCLLSAAAGRRIESLADAEYLLERAPENGYLLFRMGEAFARLGEYDRAIELLKRASDCGFRALQLLQQFELTPALRPFTSLPVFRHFIFEVEEKVGELKSQCLRLTDHE